MTTKASKLTFEEWQNLPETKERYDIVDGVMIVPPGPTDEHQWDSQEIFAQGRNFVRERNLGVFMMAPMSLLIQREPLRVRQPDLMYLNAERTGIRSRADLTGNHFLEVPPDVVVEVLSPSNTRREMAAKLRDYRLIGVYECWLVNPDRKTIEIIDLTGDEPESLATFGVGDVFRSQRLPGFELDFAEIYG